MSRIEFLGLSVLSYMIARLLHYAVLKCEDADTHPRLRTVLCWVMYLFYFLGIIVTLLLGLIENLIADVFLNFTRPISASCAAAMPPSKKMFAPFLLIPIHTKQCSPR